MFLGVCGSPFIVNCDADVQQLFEVVQFQFKKGTPEGKKCKCD